MSWSKTTSQLFRLCDLWPSFIVLVLFPYSLTSHSFSGSYKGRNIVPTPSQPVRAHKTQRFPPGNNSQINYHPTSRWPHFISSPKPIFAGIWRSVGNHFEWWPARSVAAGSKLWIRPGRNIKANTWNTVTAASKTAKGNPDWEYAADGDGEGVFETDHITS